MCVCLHVRLVHVAVGAGPYCAGRDAVSVLYEVVAAVAAAVAAFTAGGGGTIEAADAGAGAVVAAAVG